MKTQAIAPFQNSRAITQNIAEFNQRRDLNEVEVAAREFIETAGQELHRLNQAQSQAVWNLFTLGGIEISSRQKYERKGKFEARLKELQEKYGDAASKADEDYISFKNNPEIAAKSKELHDKKDQIRNPFIQRQIDGAYDEFSECGIDPALEKQISDNLTKLSVMYGDFKPEFRGKLYTGDEVEDLIGKTRDPREAIELVQAKLALGNHRMTKDGPTIAEAILEGVKLRNAFARKAGGANYYSYSLAMQEINESDLVKLREEVKRELKPLYDKLRKMMDQVSMKRYGISEAEARLPWFQGGVVEFNILDDAVSFTPDKYFKGMDPRTYIKATARQMGENVDDIVDKSDLFPRPGKNPHWYMFSLSIPDDLRTFGNIDPKFKKNMGYTFSTELHEVIGHGMGYSFVDPNLPPLLQDLHTIITESDAMMMEYMMYNKHWLKEVAKFDDETMSQFLIKGTQYRLAHELLTFFKNYLLIPDFERELYYLSDDELTLKNVNKLWAEKVEEYLGIKIPKDRNEPDWTYKIHFATAPAYYQGYFLGQLVRAQSNAKIDELDPERGLLSTACGQYLREFRSVGDSYKWDELVYHMTGKPLGIDALKAQFEKLNI